MVEEIYRNMTNNKTMEEPISSLFEGDNDATDNNVEKNAFVDDFGSFVALVCAVSFVLVIVGFWLREYCKRKHGRDICIGAATVRGGMASHNRASAVQPHQDNSMVDEDEQLARQLQEQFKEEEKEARLERKRQERRKKYKALLKKNTMVVKEDQLFYLPPDIESGEFSPELHEQHKQQTDISDVDTAQGSDDNDPVESIQQHHYNEDALRLKIPETEKHKCVSGTCTICICPYEVGERVIWSTNESCKHAFHEECILLWLSKGKKRCPVCRYYFCPTLHLNKEDVKQLTEDAEREDEEESENSDGERSTHEEETASAEDNNDAESTQSHASEHHQYDGGNPFTGF